MTRNDFIEQLEGYLKRVRSAYSYLDAYEAIIDAYYKNPNEIQLAPGFFTVTSYSLYNSLLMELAKLYCIKRKSSERTISKLINLLQDNRHLFKTEDDIHSLIEKATLKLGDMEQEIHILKTRRDNFMAHNDPLCFNRNFDPGQEFHVSIWSIMKLICFAEELCKHVFSLIDDREVCTRMRNSGDLNKLLAYTHKNK